MQKPWTGKVVFVLVVLVVGGGIFLHFFNRGPQPANPPPAVLQKAESSSSRAFSSRQQAATDAEETLAQTNNELATILALKLPREKIEEYLLLGMSLPRQYQFVQEVDNAPFEAMPAT